MVSEVMQMAVEQLRTGHLSTVRPANMRRTRMVIIAWALLAAIGWGVAGVAAVISARERQMAERLAAEAGLTPVGGAGVEVVVSDADQAVKPGENPSLALVQDSDLIFLNMMLWYGGARAVAINGERVTAQSTIVSSGPVIMVNRRRIIGPFRITAVGDPQVLRGVLETRGGFVERMRQSGLGVDVTPRTRLTVPGANSLLI